MRHLGKKKCDITPKYKCDICDIFPPIMRHKTDPTNLVINKKIRKLVKI